MKEIRFLKGIEVFFIFFLSILKKDYILVQAESENFDYGAASDMETGCIAQLA